MSSLDFMYRERVSSKGDWALSPPPRSNIAIMTEKRRERNRPNNDVYVSKK